MSNETLVFLACVLVVGIALYEYVRIWKPAMVEEFEDISSPNYFSKFFPRRYDIVPGQTMEDFGFLRDPRYSESYADIQGNGMKNDFCRVVMRPSSHRDELGTLSSQSTPGDSKSMFVACALAGTEGLDPYSFKSKTVGKGFRISRDDYYNDANGDGRADYCRILKNGDAWSAQCALATQDGFSDRDIEDAKPPADIKDLLWFYEGIMVWYRFFDDFVDYGENANISRFGDVKIDEDPRKGKTQGLELNRIQSSYLERGIPVKNAPAAEQFLRLGETQELAFGSAVKLRYLRAVSCWVRFDAFTNNARIFDFGNGSGQDNVLLGIDGRGDTDPKQMEFNMARPSDSDRVCRSKPAKEVSPQRFVKISDANVDEWECEGPGPVDTPLEEKDFSVAQDLIPTAALVFEIWDARQRKMRIKVPKAILLGKWQHICLTTMDAESFRPTWKVFVDGRDMYTEEDGHLPQTSLTAANYIGKSNWENNETQYANKDERFRGSLFDFRLYKTPMSQAKIDRTILWGKPKLFLEE
jgi:Concanavalin A-like lectin/glucanases superfamily